MVVGIRIANVTNVTITNCNITNGGDGISLLMFSSGITIIDNTITNMAGGSGPLGTVFGNGIAVANHETNFTNVAPNTITDNKINNVTFSIFIGTSYLGIITGNRINGRDIGIQFKPRPPNTTNGVINVTINGNKINAGNIGISFGNVTYAYLNLEGNKIQGTNATVEVSPNAIFTQLLLNNNAFWGKSGDLYDLYLSTISIDFNNWINNTLNGTEFT